MSFYPKGFIKNNVDFVSVHLTLESSVRKTVEIQARISFLDPRGMYPVGRISKKAFASKERLEFNYFYTLQSLMDDPYNFDTNPFILECEVI